MDLVSLQLTVTRSGAFSVRPAGYVLADSSHVPVSQLPARLQLNFAADARTRAKVKTSMNNLLVTVENVSVKPTGLK